MSVSSNESWLVVSGSGGTTPGSLTATIDPSGLTPGDYSASIIINSTAANDPLTIPVTLGQSRSQLRHRNPSWPSPSRRRARRPWSDFDRTAAAFTGRYRIYPYLREATGCRLPAEAIPRRLLISSILEPFAGTHNGTVTQRSECRQQPLMIPVTLVVAVPILSSSPSSFSFPTRSATRRLAVRRHQITSSQGTRSRHRPPRIPAAPVASSTGATTPGTVAHYWILQAGKPAPAPVRPHAAATAGNSPWGNSGDLHRQRIRRAHRRAERCAAPKPQGAAAWRHKPPTSCGSARHPVTYIPQDRLGSVHRSPTSLKI